MRGLVIIPTYNERENLPEAVRRVWDILPALDILVVDDASPDGTGEVARALADSSGGRLHLLQRQGKEGLGRAYVHAFQVALTMPYEFIVQMDCDLSHDPAHLPAMIRALDNSDLVVGSRYLNGTISVVGWDFQRLLLSKFGSWYVRAITGLRLTDGTSGFRCWRTAALASIGLNELSSQGYLIQVETAYWAFRQGLRITEVPIVFYERRIGQSKIDLRIVSEAALGVITLRFRFHRCMRQKVLNRIPTKPIHQEPSSPQLPPP